jgi:hypothetical protein
VNCREAGLFIHPPIGNGSMLATCAANPEEFAFKSVGRTAALPQRKARRTQRKAQWQKTVLVQETRVFTGLGHATMLGYALAQLSD